MLTNRSTKYQLSDHELEWCHEEGILNIHYWSDGTWCYSDELKSYLRAGKPNEYKTIGVQYATFTEDGLFDVNDI